jgi:hypothetical protein
MQRLRIIWLIAWASTLLVAGVAHSSVVSADTCQLITRLGDQPAGCLPSASPTAVASSTAIFHTILPRDTDPAIDDPAGGSHLASAAACTDPHRDFLVLFLAATNNDAAQGRPLLDVATRNCLHAIGLSYPNKEAVFTDCTNDPNPDCYEQWRLQKLDGIQRSTHLTTTPPNGIENRLLKLLRSLATTYPSEGWDRYLDGSTVRWSSVIATGQAQGGGMAAILGKVHPLARVAMFSAIPDAIGGFSGSSPAWVAKPGATPADRYYGFAHMKDQFWPGEQQNWAALTLTQFGPIVNADSAGAPYAGTHMLTTAITYDASVPNGAAATTIAARNAEKFDPVWTYMLLPA